MDPKQLELARDLAKKWKDEASLVGGIGLVLQALLDRGDEFERLATARAAANKTLRASLSESHHECDMLKEDVAHLQARVKTLETTFALDAFGEEPITKK